MDIHPPEGRVESLKDFSKHILIVTIGILIALGLEGIRESWREHTAVRDVRERFRAELFLDQSRLQLDQADERHLDSLLDQVISDMPQLTKNPAELETRIEEIDETIAIPRIEISLRLDPASLARLAEAIPGRRG